MRCIEDTVLRRIDMTSHKIRSGMLLGLYNSDQSRKRAAHGLSPETHKTKRGKKEPELDLTRA